MNLNLLIIGRTPPPTGGVSIHVARLIQLLDKEKYVYSYYDLEKYHLFSLIFAIKKAELIHLHSSSPFFRLFIAILCKLLCAKLISTIHGNLGRFNLFKNKIDFLALRFTNYPVTINNESYYLGLKKNKKTKKISAFIPEISPNKLDKNIDEKINMLKMRSKKMFCTNASALSYDKYGNEIYNISMLVETFKNQLDLGLIISDPSGENKRGLDKRGINIPENIIFINEEHSFIEVIKSSNTFIRATTTDGDSLSIHEAIYFGKTVIATDCVSRPKGVVLYNGSKLELNKLIVGPLNSDKIDQSITNNG